MNKDLSILIITPVKHIENLKKKFNFFNKIKIIENPTYNQVFREIDKFEVLFTNPNMSKVYIDEKLLKKGENLKCVVTASTGTNHIDMDSLKKFKIKLISLTRDFRIINKISSTAEHALALTLSQVRNIISSNNSVMKGQWNYLNFIGRQFTDLKIGIIGYGRLGKKYARYISSLRSKVLVYDPFVKVSNLRFKQVNHLNEIFKNCDIISIHVHVTKKTTNLVNSNLLKIAKKNLILINTSRGEVINEKDLVNFLKNNDQSKYATDVLSNELKDKKNNPIFKYSKKSKQILITPHIAGMTIEAQFIAYNRVLDKVIKYLSKK